MKKLVVLLVLIVAPISTYASTDYQCVTKCTSEGNQYGLCLSRCSWDDSSQQPSRETYQAPQIKQTDYQCVQRCTSNGYQHGLCMGKCSY